MAGRSIKVTLTVTNGAYTIADVVGGLITLAGATESNGERTSIINSVKLAGVAAIAYELWLFNANIATPAADNAPLTIVAADENKFLGVIPITAADYYASDAGFNVATCRACGLMVKSADATPGTIYAYLKATAVTSPGTTTLYLTVDCEFIN